MKTAVQVAACILIAGLAALAVAADVSGEWVFRMPTPNGEMEAKLTMKVDGNKLSGTFVFEGDRKLEISNGTVDGRKLKFTVKRDRPSGGFMIYEMTGAVEGDQIKGMTEADMDGQKVTQEWSAKRK